MLTELRIVYDCACRGDKVDSRALKMGFCYYKVESEELNVPGRYPISLLLLLLKQLLTKA